MSILQRKLDKDWRHYKYCAVDVETTGLDLVKDEVISVGAVTIIDGRFKAAGNFYEEITPLQQPSHSSIEVHGLRGIDLVSAKSAAEVIPDLIAYIDGKYLIAHASWVEEAFLSQRMQHHDHKYPKEVIDTAALARYAGYAEKKTGHEPSLEFLARKLNLAVHTPHHALGDALTTAAVFLALAAKIEKKILIERGEILTLKTLLSLSKG